MQYLVIAHDGTDADAPARRQRVRAAHLEGLRPLLDRETVAVAGAILDAAGGAVGSALIVEADDEEAVRDLIEGDVYFREGVWQRFEVLPFRQAA